MIVGVDISSRRIDLAWLEDGKPQRWHQELEGKHLIDRLRSIEIHWPNGSHGSCIDPGPWDVTDVAVEYPFGRSRTSVAALMACVGVVTRQAPPWARVAWPSAGELRTAIGAKNNKQDAHRVIRSGECCSEDWWTPLMRWDEHELDALTACIGWTRILAAQE